MHQTFRLPPRLAAIVAALVMLFFGGSTRCDAGDVFLNDARPVYDGSWYQPSVYLLASGRYTLAPGETLVSSTITWAWANGYYQRWTETVAVDGTLAAPGHFRWAAGSRRYGTPTMPYWITGVRFSITYRTAKGVLVTKSTP